VKSWNALPAFLLDESYRPEAAESNRRAPMIATKPGHASEKTEAIQAPLNEIQANPGPAGKMPGSGVTSRSGMGDNLSEIVV
jgi:hypothetical protein